jgi:preprotein translocase subunit SecG
MTENIFNNPCKKVDWRDEYDHASKREYVSPVFLIGLSFGLGIGGSPSGAFGARGAADFLTRSTKWLAIAFVVLSIVLAALAVRESSVGGVTSTLNRDAGAPAGPDLLADPVAPPAAVPAAPAPAAPAAPAGEDPLAE